MEGRHREHVGGGEMSSVSDGDTADESRAEPVLAATWRSSEAPLIGPDMARDMEGMGVGAETDEGAQMMLWALRA